jgi:hypothetical protein
MSIFGFQRLMMRTAEWEFHVTSMKNVKKKKNDYFDN